MTVDPRALVTVLMVLMNYIITTYVELQGAFIVYLLNNVDQHQDRFFAESSFRSNYSLEKLEKWRVRRQLL